MCFLISCIELLSNKESDSIFWILSLTLSSSPFAPYLVKLIRKPRCSLLWEHVKTIHRNSCSSSTPTNRKTQSQSSSPALLSHFQTSLECVAFSQKNVILQVTRLLISYWSVFGVISQYHKQIWKESLIYLGCSQHITIVLRLLKVYF